MLKKERKKERRVPASNINIETANNSVFLIREISMLNVGPQIVEPSQSTTFPTSIQTWPNTHMQHIYEILQRFQSIFDKLINYIHNIYTSFMRKSNPIPSGAMLLYVVLQLWVFFQWPWPSLNTCLVTTWSSSHLFLSENSICFNFDDTNSHFLIMLMELWWVVS